MMKRNILALALLASAMPAVLCAQVKYDVESIPDSLKKNAFSVVRSYDVDVDASARSESAVHFRRVVTILNKKGLDHSGWHRVYDKFSYLSSFSGKAYDANGNVISKIKQKDLRTTAVSSNLASDNVHFYYECEILSYPFTIEYEWTEKSRGGYIDFPVFSPMKYSHQSMQEATYQITASPKVEILKYETPSKKNYDVRETPNGKVYKWTFPAHRHLVDEDYIDDDDMRYPMVIAEPSEFSIGGSTGSLKSWEEFGKWYWQLAEGRDVLPKEEIAKVNSLTADSKTDLDKIKALYKYLGEKTRYVNISLGLGGWQPMSATEVSRTGFGDCKALANYMQALLKQVGITSYQVVISTEDENLLKNFPNMHQLNHVVLYIVRPDDKFILMDCTCPQLPLGFIHSSLAGHECLLVTPDGGKIVRLPDYSAADSRETLSADVKIGSDGNGKLTFSCDHFGRRYSRTFGMAREDKGEQKKIVRRWIRLDDATVTDVEVKDFHEEEKPHLLVKCSMTAVYGKMNGSRMFIRCNPFRSFGTPRFRNERTSPIVIDNSYSYCDTVRISIPDDMKIEALPNPLKEESEFGSFSFAAVPQGNVVTVVSTMECRKGKHDISKKDDFLKYMEKRSKAYGATIVLVKK